MKIILLMLAALTVQSGVGWAQSTGSGGGGDRPGQVRFVRNGSTVCNEGDQIFFTEDRPNGRSQLVLRTCENGRYYPKKKVSTTRCLDGQRLWATERSKKTQRGVQVLRICKAGRYVLATDENQN